MFSWGKIKNSNGSIGYDGSIGYGRKRISTGITIEPHNLSNGDLKFLPSNLVTEYARKIEKVKRAGEKAFDQLLEELQSTELILPEMFKQKIDEVLGKKERKYPYSFDILESIDQIIKVKNVAPSRATQLISCGKNLKIWAEKVGISLDWRSFSDQDYFDFLQYKKNGDHTSEEWEDLTNEQKEQVNRASDSTVDQYRKRINSFIRELVAEKVPVKATPRSGRNLTVTAKAKVNLKEEHLMKIFQNEPQRTKYPRANYRKSNIRKILMILLSTGCRISDMWQVIDQDNWRTLEDGNLYVDYIASKQLKGKKRNRVVCPIFPNIKEMLQNNPPEKVSDDKVRKGIKDYMIEVFGENATINTDEGALNVALDFHPHACRSTFSSLCARLFISERLSDQILAHTQNKGVNDAYIQLTKEEQAQALRKILIKEKKIKFFSKKAEFEFYIAYFA